MMKEEKKYIKICDQCEEVIESDYTYFRVISEGTITIEHVGKYGVNFTNIYDNLDFCSVKCASKYFTDICKNLTNNKDKK